MLFTFKLGMLAFKMFVLLPQPDFWVGTEQLDLTISMVIFWEKSIVRICAELHNFGFNTWHRLDSVTRFHKTVLPEVIHFSYGNYMALYNSWHPWWLFEVIMEDEMLGDWLEARMIRCSLDKTRLLSPLLSKKLYLWYFYYNIYSRSKLYIRPVNTLKT